VVGAIFGVRGWFDDLDGGPNDRIRRVVRVAHCDTMQRHMDSRASRVRRFVRHALVAATDDDSPDGAQLRAAFDLLCDQLWFRLRPLFGELALKALFARALHVARAEFSWLEGVTVTVDNRCALDGLDTVSRDLAPQVLAEGLAAVLAHQVALLSAFIGDDIVLPLVEQAWGAASTSERRASNEGDT
jgi:hypothetical protein